MKFAAYPSYEPSGIEWVGDVPKHWEVRRSDESVTTSRTQLEPRSFADQTVFHYSIPVVQQSGTGQFEDGADAESAKQLITEPVVLVSKLNPRKATVCIARPATVLTLCSTEFVALKPTQCDLRFLYYLALSELFRQRLDSLVQSVTRSHQRADPQQIARFWAAWPPHPEQRAIATFLDAQTAKIDTLVAKKRELIEKLKEKRAALISHTVTRGLPPEAARGAGLDPHPRLKASGVEWLGDVPEHWEVARLRMKWTVLDCKHRTMPFVDDGIPVASIAEALGYEVDLAMANRTTYEEFVVMIEGGRQPRVGDIIYSRNATVGSAAMVTTTEPFCLGQDVCLIRSMSQDPGYTLYLLRSTALVEQTEAEMIGSTFRRINIGQIKSFWACIPPRAEQAAIAAYLAGETANIDQMIASVDAAIERLEEYRTALITAAVTGKIDVRAAAGVREPVPEAAA